MTALLIRLYGWLLRFYPRKFYAAFGNEMQATFAEALTEATHRGFIAAARVCSRELLDLPGAILRAHWQTRSVSMENQPRMSWLELLCTAIPFLIYLALPIMEGLQFSWTGVVFLILLGTLFILMVVGLFKGMPRWSLPAFGLLLAILNYMMFGVLGFAFQGLTAAPPLFLREIFGSGFHYIGIIVLTLVVILVTASIKSLHPFFQRIREDWTLFPFALYGILPLAIFISFDEYRGSTPYEIGMGLSLLAGLWLYLRINQLGRKLLMLGIAITLAMATEAIGKWMLIPSQTWVDLAQPDAVAQTIRGEVISTMYTWFWVMVVVLLPALLGLLPRSTRLTPATQP